MEILFYFLLFLSFFLFSRFFLSKKTKNLPPSPPTIPIIGHLHLLKKPLYRSLASITDKYGPVLYLWFGSRPVLVVSTPSAVEDCFTKNNDIVFANRPHFFLMGKLLGNNYTTIDSAPYGPNWRNLRRISAIEVLSATRVHSYGGIRLDEVKSMVKRLSNIGSDEYRTVEMKSMFFELTFNIMMRIIAGKRYYGEHVEDLEEAKRFQEVVKETFVLSGASNIGDFLPFLNLVGVKGFKKRIMSVVTRKDKAMQELIEERRSLRKSEFNVEEKEKTLIDVLLSLQETEPDYYTDEMIRGFTWVMVAAGTDTSAGTMEWAMSLLVNNPQVIKKAQAEIDAHVEKGRLLNESDINNLPYLHCIINETLRMYPAGPLLVPHESSEDCVVGGFNIPRTTMLLINMWQIQNDPKLWDEPTKFKPERFEGLEGTRDGFKFMPFGSGRRGCPGEGLAMRVVPLALGALIQCFDWERVGDELVDMSEGLGLTLPKAEPLEVKCKTRSSASNMVSQF
ncbi:Cytochrome p450 [Thalictrum thalictroides]|uniref:Cytochrome p450 n=1 Tax=Thalictrum thalictroides TaxID=46969 RepID=A0A7J6WCT7_THATH|nr:Cytochrome p450 [Thalictrum thalictroides]